MDKKIVITLDEHFKNKYNSQKEFAKATGLREATISQLINNKYDRIQLSHLLKIMETLEIKDFNEILKIVDEE